MILYHYTSKAAFDEIIRTGDIKPTDPWTTMDKAYGHGWYFTDIEPTHCYAWTVAYCWRDVSTSVFGKTEAYLKFEMPDHLPRHCRDHVYMLSQWDDNIKYLEGKTTNKCSKGPCFICDILTKVKKAFGWS